MNMTIGCPIPGASQPKEPVRLIDANALLKNEVRLRPLNGDDLIGGVTSDDIISAPTIDPESLRPTAYWRGDYDGYADGNPVYDIWHCSSCEYCIDDGTDDPELLPKYCPNCGARMVNAYEQDNKSPYRL